MIEFGDEEEEEADSDDKRTDEEKGLSHGYEGDFKIGDIVKVRKYGIKKYGFKIIQIIVCI